MSIRCTHCDRTDIARLPAAGQCGGCRVALYCSPQCQKLDWQEYHAEECGKLIGVEPTSLILILTGIWMTGFAIAAIPASIFTILSEDIVRTANAKRMFKRLGQLVAVRAVMEIDTNQKIVDFKARGKYTKQVQKLSLAWNQYEFVERNEVLRTLPNGILDDIQAAVEAQFARASDRDPTPFTEGRDKVVQRITAAFGRVALDGSWRQEWRNEISRLGGEYANRIFDYFATWYELLGQESRPIEEDTPFRITEKEMRALIKRQKPILKDIQVRGERLGAYIDDIYKRSS